MNGTYHMNAKKELRSFQYDLVDLFVKISEDEKHLVNLIEKYPAWQMGKTKILESDYLKLCVRRKKLERITKNL